MSSILGKQSSQPVEKTVDGHCGKDGGQNHQTRDGKLTMQILTCINYVLTINHLFMGRVQPQPKSTIRTRALDANRPCHSLEDITKMEVDSQAPLNLHPVPHPVLLSTVQSIHLSQINVIHSHEKTAHTTGPNSRFSIVLVETGEAVRLIFTSGFLGLSRGCGRAVITPSMAGTISSSTLFSSCNLF